MPSDSHHEATAAFAYELGVLKRIRRSGWWHAEVRDPESVAEHSLRVAQLAAILAAEEGANPERAAYLGLWHDTAETRTGDIPHTARPYLAKADAEAISKDQVGGIAPTAADSVTAAVAEHEAGDSAEARCSRDADKLECLLQAIEYRAAGYTHTQGWIDSSRGSLQTETARRIAEAAQTVSPLSWRNR